MYWDGNTKPSVECPAGDFFGLNLGQYSLYQSAYTNCAPIRALNCYFAMPFRKSARITATNEGKQDVGAFYSNIDYQVVPALPDDAMYFHAQYRQATPNVGTDNEWKANPDANKLKNPDGRQNYVFAETRGRGHLMGITMGVLQNQEFWMGEGDEMIYIDDPNKPAIIGTGSEDYLLGAWDFGGREGAIQWGYLYAGSHLMSAAERTGGRYCCYRWHGDNPVTFNRYMKMTMEHGHANHRSDNWYTCCYWYQSQPYTDFPPLPPVSQRIVEMKSVGGPGGARS